MKRCLILILVSAFFCLLTESPSEAQLWKMRRFEAVAGAGPTLFFGDIGGFSRKENILGIRDLNILQTRFHLSLNLKYRITQELNARLGFTYGFFHASDSRGSNEEREYEAITSFFEPVLIAEYYFIKNRTENSYLFTQGRDNGSGGLLSSLDFYVFAGFGGLNYSVKGNDELNSYGIEPGGFTAVIPAGVGTTLVYSPDFNFGVEIGGRYAFSDYLDGFTSQYSSSNDVYYFLNFTITYKMKTGPHGLPSFR